MATTGTAATSEAPIVPGEGESWAIDVQTIADSLLDMPAKDVTEQIEQSLDQHFAGELEKKVWCPAQKRAGSGPCEYGPPAQGEAAPQNTLSAIMLHLNDDHISWDYEKIGEWATGQGATSVGTLLKSCEGVLTQQRGKYLDTPTDKTKAPHADVLAAIFCAGVAAQLIDDD